MGRPRRHTHRYLTPMQLRTYVDADQAAVAELWQRAGLMQNPLNDPVRDIAFCVAGGHGEILVLEDAGIIVATVMVGQDGHRGWIHYLAVEPERQGEHLGLRIVRAAEDRLKEQGVPKVHLMVRGSNTEAVGFYQRQGYRVEPVTTMSRRLDGQALPVGHQMDDEPVMITYLEMTQRPSLPQIIPKARKYALLGAHEMTVGFYRYLYDAVGRPWYWTDRKRLSDQELAVIIEDDGVEIYVLYIGGAPAGFYELDARQMPTVDLAYFGIMPDYIGLGLGPYLLVQAIDMMWQKEPDRVTVNTCTLDHPKALPLYQRMGFQPYDRQEVPAPWQDPDNILDFA
ncbi:MAG: GNAT family acetyltransferase [Alphaproteobacteria bacterium]|nr:GNAT family acetyltransferase [Alphaproteobacteria bacterium]